MDIVHVIENGIAIVEVIREDTMIVIKRRDTKLRKNTTKEIVTMTEAEVIGKEMSFAINIIIIHEINHLCRRDKHRRSDDRKFSYKNDRDEYDRNRDRKKEESSNGAPIRIHSPQNQRGAHSSSGGGSGGAGGSGGTPNSDYSWRKESPSSSYQSEKQPPTSTNQFRPHHDDKDSRTKFAMQKAEAISRSIERRANEKMHQLQKLGIEVPGITAMSQQPLQQGLIQPPPLMAQNTHIRFGSPQPTSTVTSLDSSGAASATINDNDNGGINLANFTSPVLVNPRYTEQMQKKKLIWGAKKAAAEQAEKVTTTNKWETAKFSQDNDGKMASKFLRLMGMKGSAAAPATSAPATKSDDSSEDTASVDPSVKKRQEMFTSMEQQYEVARQATHTMRGMGLGFGSSRPY